MRAATLGAGRLGQWYRTPEAELPAILPVGRLAGADPAGVVVCVVVDPGHWVSVQHLRPSLRVVGATAWPGRGPLGDLAPAVHLARQVVACALVGGPASVRMAEGWGPVVQADRLTVDGDAVVAMIADHHQVLPLRYITACVPA